MIKSILVLVGGGAVAHGIIALSMPILSRIYSPHDFGVFAIYGAVVAIIGSVSCLRYDVAIALPDSDEEAFELLVLSVVIASVIAFVLSVLVFVGKVIFGRCVGYSIPDLYFAVPFGVGLAGIYVALQQWAIRNGEFNRISKGKVAQNVVGAATQIALGTLGVRPFGLILGGVSNYAFVNSFLALGSLHQFKRWMACQDRYWRLKTIFVKYIEFPRYSVWEALANSASLQLPILIIAALAGQSESGYLSMAMMAMQAPLALIGGSVGQVYLSSAPEAARNGVMKSLTISSVEGLIKVGVGPIVIIGLMGPQLFGEILGHEWERAGNLVQWMTPWMLLQFISSPISMALHVVGKQKTAMRLQVFGLLFRVVCVTLVGNLYPDYSSETYALTGFFFYFAYFVSIAKATGICNRDYVVIIKRVWLIPTALSIAAVGVVLLSRMHEQGFTWGG